MAWKETERSDFGGGRAVYGVAAGVVLDAAGGLALVALLPALVDPELDVPAASNRRRPAAAESGGQRR